MSGDTAWTRGGRQDDQALTYPEYLGHDGAHLYVADQATHTVTAFDQATGKTAWITDPKTSVLKNPAAMSGLPSGGVAVINGASQTLSLLSPGGTVAREVPLNEAAAARQVCSLSDSTFLLAVPRTRFPLVAIDVTGRTVSRQELPWPAVRDRSPIETQVLLTSAGPAECVVALVYGGGLALVDQRGSRWQAPYVEGASLPSLKVTKEERDGTQRVSSKILASHVPVLDVAANDSTVDVVYDGNSPERPKLIDSYSMRDGRYVASRQSERRIVSLQETPTRLFALTGWNGYPALVALTRRSPAAAASVRPSARHDAQGR